MKVAFLGATKGMGRALARLMAERGDTLFLLGRDLADLERCASDLELRGAAGEVGFAACDLSHPAGFASALDAAERHLGGLEAVVVTAGIYGTQEALEADGELRRSVLAVDFNNTIEFCEQARARLLGAGGGLLCVFGSVAGDRARKPVILYGAAKAGLAFYLEGLDLRYRSQGLRTVLVKPGFVRTGMTAGLREPPIVSEPETAARAALRAIDRGRPVAYAPPVWRAVMLAVRSIPRWLMRRVEF
jgi:short-subunit dehydrogenase